MDRVEKIRAIIIAVMVSIAIASAFFNPSPLEECTPEEITTAMREQMTGSTTASTSRTKATAGATKAPEYREERMESRHKTTTITTTTTTTTTTTAESTTTKSTRKTTKKRAETTTTATKSTTTTTTPTSANVSGKSLGTFKVVGYSSEEATVGTVSASGLPLIPGKTCAMNRGDMQRLGIKYGDYIEVVGFGKLQVTDCGCRSGKVDVYCATIADCYAITQMAEVVKS